MTSPACLVRRLLVAVIAVGGAVSVAAPMPIAQAATAGHIALASQSSWVTGGGSFDLLMHVTGVTDPSDLEVAVIVHPALTSRSDFQRSVDGKVSGSALGIAARALNELDPTHKGEVRSTLLVQDQTQPRDDSRLQLRKPGVYPVEVELRESGGGKVADRFVTHLVYVPTTLPGPKLGVAWVAPVHAPLALTSSGTRKLSDASSASLAALAAAVDRVPSLPLTLHPTPETLAALAASARPADAETLKALVRAAQAHQVLAGTYVPVSPPAYGADDQSELAAQLDHGTDVIADVLKVRPETRTQVDDDGLDDVSVGHLQDLQIDRLLIRSAALAVSEQRLTPSQPFQLAGRPGRRLTTLAADTGFSSRFDEKDSVLGAHHLLADLAMAYFEFPANTRGVVALPSTSWRPSTAFLDAFLPGLAESPVLAPMTLDQAFDDIPAATTSRRVPLVRRLSTTAPKPVALASNLRTVRKRLDDFGGLVDPGTAMFVTLDEGLLASQSTELRASQRRTFTSAVDTRIDTQLSLIRVPASRSITLTAREGEIPVTVLNETGYPVHVQVRLSSDQLRFPGGTRAAVQSVDLTHRNTTARFRVQARTSGSFPIRIELVSPDGQLTVGTSRFVVRSTAASGVGIVLSVSAALFLLVWWARHAMRARRGRPRQPVTVGAR
ncbi:MAG TPA: DUF6049 family protein [Acidimicrobiales bacterium]|nr:DUF6049 family protein [Acidimicrobiales bacterium]